MTEADAQVRLGYMTAASSEPTLDSSEIAELVAMSRVIDANGLAPSDAGWIPTFDLNRGAAEGWRWKAAKVVANFAFTSDGQTFNRQQVVEACERMAEQYRRKIHSAITVLGAMARADN